MNLDDVLAGAEMAKQYPVAPSMPIHAPSDPQQPSPSESPLPSNSSQRQTPQSSGQVWALHLAAWATIRPACQESLSCTECVWLTKNILQGEAEVKQAFAPHLR